MKNRHIRQILFFSVVFLLYYTSIQLGHKWVKSQSWITELGISLVYTLIILGVFYLAKLEQKCPENFWDVNPASLCRGGPYMWQGDSNTAKLCRELAESKEGRVMISSYNCPKGFVGLPAVPFEYTPLSNDNWEDERTQPSTPVNLVDPGPDVRSQVAQIQN